MSSLGTSPLFPEVAENGVLWNDLLAGVGGGSSMTAFFYLCVCSHTGYLAGFF